MPISATYNVKGGTLVQYDQIIKGLAEQAASPGGLAHIAAATSDGFIVCDIWDSQESFDSFSPNLGPHVEVAGLGDKAAPFMGHVENLVISERINQLPAVAIFYTFPGMTVEKYHDVLQQAQFDTVATTARRAHIAIQTPEGMFIVAVWESESAFRQFEPALKAAFANNGIEAPAPVIAKIHRIAVSPDAARSFAPA